MAIHQALREAVGDDFVLLTDPVGEYSLDEAIKVGRHLEKLNYLWFEEPFRDFELYKYSENVPCAGYPGGRNGNDARVPWGVAQSIAPARLAADIVRADVSWKNGITGTLKIAHLAKAFGLRCSTRRP